MARWLTATRRIGVALVTIVSIVSFVWLLLNATRDPNVAEIQRALVRQGASDAEIQRAIQQYLDRRGRLAPLHERYGAWLGDFLTLDWGRSYSLIRGPEGRPRSTVGVNLFGLPEGAERMPVTGALAYGLPRTLGYVVPSVLFAVVIGVGVGMYTTLAPESPLTRPTLVGSYLGSGLPNFYLAVFLPIVVAIPLNLLGVGLTETVGSGPFERSVLAADLGPFDLQTTILPIVVLTLGLLGTQIRHTRTEALEFEKTAFVRLVRAKGAGPVRVARHILRNAALPLVTLFSTEVFAALVVDVFVIEYVFAIEGIGWMGLTAILDRDYPLVLGITAVVVGAGVLGTLLQDLSHRYLDPRIDD